MKKDVDTALMRADMFEDVAGQLGSESFLHGCDWAASCRSGLASDKPRFLPLRCVAKKI